MPVNSYECLFLLDPTKTATDLEGAKATLNGTLQKHGAEVIVSRKWDDRKLAYPIKGHKKGVYHLAYFKADSLKIADIELDFRLSEIILRHLVSLIDPKWDAEMVAVAKDEHRMALQIIHEESPEGGAALAGVPGEAVGIPVDDVGDARTRRGPRRGAEGEVGKE